MLTKKDAENVPFIWTLLFIIIFILNWEFASVLNCVHWRKWTISSCHSIFVPPEPQLYLLIRATFQHWVTNIWDGRGWQGESSARRVGRQIQILRISPQSYLNSLVWDVRWKPHTKCWSSCIICCSSYQLYALKQSLSLSVLFLVNIYIYKGH